jgi:NAD(P)-dependent dehydrogenase (short-subunit alcohol dehydrogenase family)
VLATQQCRKAWFYPVVETALLQARYPPGRIACAGVSGENPGVDYPIDAFRWIVDVDLNGACICAQAAACEIGKHKHSASVVLVASIHGHGYNKVPCLIFPWMPACPSVCMLIHIPLLQGFDTAAYNSSKSGVHRLARSLATEWGNRVEYPLIRVNTLSPSYTRTPMTNDVLKYPE